MTIINRLNDFIDNQYKKLQGLIGTYIGEKMVRQHKPETFWTIELLNIKKGETVLELGCGAGYAMKQILEHTLPKEMVGLDISPAVIKSARIRNRKAIKEERAKLVQGNVQKLPFPNDHFDKLFSIHTIYFWDDIDETVSEIYRVLKPGGSFILTLCDGKDGQAWDGVKSMVQNQLIPAANKNGFINILEISGPHSRQFHTTAVIGHKHP
jgi:ubiquinone/menaquinone biosynthesis C-methylase UbiE